MPDAREVLSGLNIIGRCDGWGGESYYMRINKGKQWVVGGG